MPFLRRKFAARRAGVKTVVLPLKNRDETEVLPDYVLKDMNIQLADKIENVLDIVLTK